jgi:hypothetical protein
MFSYPFRFSLAVALLLGLTALPLTAVEIFVDSVNGNDTNTGGAGDPVKTLKAGWALIPAGGGHIMSIQPGTYGDANDAVVTSDIVNGTPGNFNRIRAEIDGTVVITQPMVLSPTPSNAGNPQADSDNFSPQYLQFEGLKWVNEIDNTGGGNGDNVVINGHHIKILRSAFRGAGNCGNLSVLKIGQGSTESVNWMPTHHILVEDSWAYGLGGRYNVQIFHADQIVLRRVVLRHDGGWLGQEDTAANCKNDPEAAIATYNSADVHLQNVVVIDSDITYSTNSGNGGANGNWEGTIYSLYNAESGVQNADNPAQNDVANVNVLGVVHPTENNVISGSIILFNHGNAFKYETGNASQVTNADGAFPPRSVKTSVLQDSVSINSGKHGLTFQTGGGGLADFDVSVQRLLIAAIAPASSGALNVGVRENSGVSPSITLNDVVVTGHASSAILNNHFLGATQTCVAPGTTNCSTAIADPVGGDLLFPVRTEGGATFTSAAIVKRIGDPETLFGDANFAAVTTTDLWPWPYESRIKRDFSEVPGVGIRRWTATDLTLTEYIWNALGADVATDAASAGVLMAVPSAVAVP